MSVFLKNLVEFKSILKDFGQRHRLIIFTLAIIIFFVGLYFSFRHIDINLSKYSYESLLIILLITQPLLIFMNALELNLCAVASDSKMTLRESVFVSSSATVANILPLPAGLVLRGAALVKGGGSLLTVSKVLLAAALLWVALAVTVSGAVIASGQLTLLIILAGGISIVLLTFYTARLSNLKTALGFLGVRSLLIIILIWQLQLCFAVLGEGVTLKDAAVYVVSGVAGAVISIVPAGLGIIEGFGALLAKLDGASSAQAYVVLSLNRLIGLALAGFSMIAFGKFLRLSSDRQNAE